MVFVFVCLVAYLALVLLRIIINKFMMTIVRKRASTQQIENSVEIYRFSKRDFRVFLRNSRWIGGL